MKFFAAAAAFLATLPLALATLVITTPTNWNASGLVTLVWTGAATDPTFSVELTNGGLNQFGNLALLNNVSPTAGSATFALGSVPVAAGYVLEFVNLANITQVYASSSSFSIGAPFTATTSTTAATTPAAAATTGAPAIVTTTASHSGSSSASGSSAGSSSTPFSSNNAALVSPKTGAIGGVLAVGFVMALL